MGFTRLLKYLSFQPVLLGFAFISTNALSASSYLDTTRIEYTRPTPTERLELIDCFKNGNCAQDAKIRIYPMPCNGSGTDDCTGCYAVRGGSPVRVGDLNPTGTCAGIGVPSEQKIRVFVGYERKCPTGIPVGDTCTGVGQLFLSCSMTSEGTSGGDAGFVYNKECFSGTPYVRRAKSAIPTITASPLPVAPVGQTGCDAGTTGIYPACVSCTDTSYKPTIGNAACTQCVPPVIVDSTRVMVTTAGTTKTSVNDCRVADFTCMTGYTKNVPNQTCTLPPPVTPPPSPPPSPSYAPSGLPDIWTCENANVAVRTSVFKTSTIPSYYVSTATYTWRNGARNNGVEMVSAHYTQLESPFYERTVPAKVSMGTTGLGTNGPDSQTGNYRLTVRYVVNGVVCPELGPYFFTVPSNGGP